MEFPHFCELSQFATRHINQATMQEMLFALQQRDAEQPWANGNKTLPRQAHSCVHADRTEQNRIEQNRTVVLFQIANRRCQGNHVRGRQALLALELRWRYTRGRATTGQDPGRPSTPTLATGPTRTGLATSQLFLSSVRTLDFSVCRVTVPQI